VAITRCTRLASQKLDFRRRLLMNRVEVEEQPKLSSRLS
jgi:hypothetical protein